MSSRILNATGAAAIAVMLASSVQTASAQISFPWERSPQGSPQGQAQSDDADADMRIQRLENQLRQLTGQNEELQYRNRQLEERLRQLGGAPVAPGGQPPVAQPGMAAAPPQVQPSPPQGQQGYPQQGYPRDQQYPDPQYQQPYPGQARQAPPAGGVQNQPLPPPDGTTAAVDPGAPGGPMALPGVPPGQRQPRGTPQPADTSPQPGDEVISEPPSQKISNKGALFSGLDKITGRIIAFDAAVGETVQFGALQVTPRICYTRPPTETPNTDAFIEVDEVTLQGDVKRIFTGWVFAASPGLHAVEHPIYDLWLTDCRGGSQVVASEGAATEPPQAQPKAKAPPQPKQKQVQPQPPRQTLPPPPPPQAQPQQQNTFPLFR